MNYTELSNNDLCRLYKDKDDQQAFNALYYRFKDTIHRRLDNLVKHDKDVIEEIEQIIWCEAARSIRTNFKFESDFKTYLYTITTTRYINFFRSYKSSFISEKQATSIDDFFYTAVNEFDALQLNGSYELHTSLTNLVEGTNLGMNEDVLDAFRLISLEVLNEHTPEEQTGYLYRIDPSKGMLKASRELSIPYDRVKETSKFIESEINRRFEKYVEHYY